MRRLADRHLSAPIALVTPWALRVHQSLGKSTGKDGNLHVTFRKHYHHLLPVQLALLERMAILQTLVVLDQSNLSLPTVAQFSPRRPLSSSCFFSNKKSTLKRRH